MKQIVLTPSMGKRLIGKGMVAHPSIQRVLQHGRLVIVAGSTNGYVAEEVLRAINQVEGFSRVGFRRGITTAHTANPPKLDFPGDVVIRDGAWQKGLTVQDMAEELVTGDVVFSNSIGRTDFPGGNGGILKKSIDRIADIPAEFVLPGHHEAVVGAESVKRNYDYIKRSFFSYL